MGPFSVKTRFTGGYGAKLFQFIEIVDGSGNVVHRKIETEETSCSENHIAADDLAVALNAFYPLPDAPVSEIERVRQEKEILKEALLFYADPETYYAIAILPDPPCGAFIDDMSYVDEFWGTRPGKTAREAAAKIGLEIVHG